LTASTHPDAEVRRRAMMAGRELAERFVRSHRSPVDWDEMRSLMHPDFVEEWPQSGERIRGFENRRAMWENYPGGAPEGVGVRRILGGEDRIIDAPVPAGPFPMFTVVRVVGTGDSFTYEGTATYPSGDTSHVVMIVELRDEKVWRLTTYFAAPFDAPEWRAAWVERT
jgi:hypothetical protein